MHLRPETDRSLLHNSMQMETYMVLGLRETKYGSSHCVMMHCIIDASALASSLITPLATPGQTHSNSQTSAEPLQCATVYSGNTPQEAVIIKEACGWMAQFSRKRSLRALCPGLVLAASPATPCAAPKAFTAHGTCTMGLHTQTTSHMLRKPFI